MTIAVELRRLYPTEWQRKRYGVLLGHPPTLAALETGESAGRIVRGWEEELARFLAVRNRYLLY
jgi:hypothetical protein